MAADDLIKVNNLNGCRRFNKIKQPVEKQNTKGRMKKDLLFLPMDLMTVREDLQKSVAIFTPSSSSMIQQCFFFFKQSTYTIIGGSCHKYHFHNINVLS